MRRIVPDERAMQGRSGKRVLAVLIGALALCVVAILGFMLWAQSTSPDESRQVRAADQPAATSSVTPGGASTSPANPAYPAPSVPSADTPTTGASGTRP